MAVWSIYRENWGGACATVQATNKIYICQVTPFNGREQQTEMSPRDTVYKCKNDSVQKHKYYDKAMMNVLFFLFFFNCSNISHNMKIPVITIYDKCLKTNLQSQIITQLILHYFLLHKVSSETENSDLIFKWLTNPLAFI